MPTEPQLTDALPCPDWIICEDGPLLAVNKPPGIITEGRGDSVVSRVKTFLKEKYQKLGNVYVGIPHRLDRDTTGTVVFTRNSKAAARVAEQFRDRTVQKTYWVLLEKPPNPAAGELTDWLVKDSEQATVEAVPFGTSNAREAKLSYRTLAVQDGKALVEVDLQTGRTHQIRVQFSSRGSAVLGDLKYGGTQWTPPVTASNLAPAPDAADVRYVGLHAMQLQLKHPIRYDELKVQASLPEFWPDWTRDLESNQH